MPSPDMDQIDRRQNDQSRRPLSVATDNMMLEFYKKDGYDPSTSAGITFSTHLAAVWGLFPNPKDWRRCVKLENSGLFFVTVFIILFSHCGLWSRKIGFTASCQQLMTETKEHEQRESLIEVTVNKVQAHLKQSQIRRRVEDFQKGISVWFLRDIADYSMRRPH